MGLRLCRVSTIHVLILRSYFLFNYVVGDALSMTIILNIFIKFMFTLNVIIIFVFTSRIPFHVFTFRNVD